MIQVHLEDLVITVDEETAEQLKDPAVATEYVRQIRNQMFPDPETSCYSASTDIWKSSKKPTTRDQEATEIFLSLREKYNEQFSDKKTSKNDLWRAISEEMNKMGYYTGEGVEGREKCRQKFANLQASFIKYNDNRRKTGEGNVKTPPYYDELLKILGDKHKTNPILIIDTLSSEENKENSGEANQSSANVCEKSSFSPSASSSTCSETRFDSIKKTVKPKSQKKSAIEELLVLQKENAETRKNEFKCLMTMFEQESKQRHEQIMALLSLRRNTEKGKKRKHSSDDSD